MRQSQFARFHRQFEFELHFHLADYLLHFFQSELVHFHLVDYLLHFLQSELLHLYDLCFALEYLLVLEQLVLSVFLVDYSQN